MIVIQKKNLLLASFLAAANKYTKTGQLTGFAIGSLIPSSASQQKKRPDTGIISLPSIQLFYIDIIGLLNMKVNTLYKFNTYKGELLILNKKNQHWRDFF